MLNLPGVDQALILRNTEKINKKLMIDTATSQFLQNYFDRVFVITLERTPHRQERVTKQLQGLPFEFFYGQDKQALDWEAIRKSTDIYDEAAAKKNDRVGKPMKVGEVACAISHRQLYKHIIEAGYRRVLIMEDDAVPLLENLNQLPAAINELPVDWDLVYLGYTKHEEITASLKRKRFFYRLISPLGMITWTPTMVKNMLPVPFSNHLRKAGYHDCLHAYAITAETAALLMNEQNPVVAKADNLISNIILQGRLKAFVTVPKFFAQEHHLDPSHVSIIHEF